MTDLPEVGVDDVWGVQLNTAIEERSVPTGGSTDQVLKKASGTDRDVSWGTIAQATEIVQSTPASTWTISVPSSFGRTPVVDVYVGGEQVETDVHASSTTVTIQFPSPTSGSAVLS